MPKKSNQDQAAVVIKIYDLTNLLYRSGDYPIQGYFLPGIDESKPGGKYRAQFGGGVGGGGLGIGGGGGGGGGVFNTPSRITQGLGGRAVIEDSAGVAKVLLADIEELIVGLVAPDSWGTETKIRRLGSKLVVTQTADVHQQIGELLNLLEQESINQTNDYAQSGLIHPNAKGLPNSRPRQGDETDVFDMRCQQFKTSVRLKPSTPTLIGGSVIPGDKNDNLQTYLILEAVLGK